MIQNRSYKLIVLLFIFTTFNACGIDDNTNWGVDHEVSQKIPQKLSKYIPTCNGDKKTTTNAIKVYAKQEIEKTIDKTVIRIWHYQNGDKLVCTVTGEAIIKYEK